jgi:D-tyrosyl-tRNA(Tyr) deacylase
MEMRALLQRVKEAKVQVMGRTVGQIEKGLVVLLGVTHDDTKEDLDYLVEKTLNLRIFPDDKGKMNRSLLDVGGELLVVSQFTLYGYCRKGRRPSFIKAAPPPLARKMYEEFINAVRQKGVRVSSGRFQEEMLVEIYNEGPVTILLDSKQ